MIGYTPDASRDILRPYLQLLDSSARAAESFATRLALAERRIDPRPLKYRRLSDPGTRRYGFKLNRTSYLIDYRIEPTHVVILRVWHGRQDRPVKSWSGAETLGALPRA